jgi:hypothetical protein
MLAKKRAISRMISAVGRLPSAGCGLLADAPVFGYFGPSQPWHAGPEAAGCLSHGPAGSRAIVDQAPLVTVAGVTTIDPCAGH